MRVYVGLGLILLALGCTPPPAVEGDRGEATGTFTGSKTANAGPAAGPAGIAFFGNQASLYGALADLVVQPITQGVRAYSLAVDSDHPEAESPEARRARKALQDAAERSAETSATREGAKLVNARVQVFAADDGATHVKVTSDLEAGGKRHREVREGVVDPATDGKKATVRWLGPPTAEP